MEADCAEMHADAFWTKPQVTLNGSRARSPEDLSNLVLVTHAPRSPPRACVFVGSANYRS